MTKDQFALRTEAIKEKLYRTAFLYLHDETRAVDAVDEAVCRALCSLRRLRQEEYFDTWITRILINECCKELRRQKRQHPVSDLADLPENAAGKTTIDYDALPLRQAIDALPKELKDIIILRYFAGYTLIETAEILGVPQGTAASRQRRALGLLRLELGEEERP